MTQTNHKKPTQPHTCTAPPMLHTHTVAMPNPSSSPSLLPPPAPTAARRRRRRLLPSSNPSSTSGASASSSTSSSAASNLSIPFPSFSPAPSPFHHRFLSPFRASAVPFSWEHRPGIPKTPARQPPRGKPGAKPKPLPLPPSLLSNKVVADPFAAAGADYFIFPENNKKTRRRRRRQQRRRPALAAALTDWMAVLSLYIRVATCTRSRDCLASAGPPPRPRPRAPAKAG